MPQNLRRGILICLLIIGVGEAILVTVRMNRSHTASLPKMGTIPNFSFTADNHTTFTNEHLLGKVTIADFIFTTCAGPCPMMSGHMQQLQATFQTHPDLQLVSFSVDPDYDTPDILHEYANRFGAISHRWYFLTGDKHRIYGLIKEGFHLPVADDENTIAHSTKFVLIDQQSAIRGYYDSDDDSALTVLTHDAQSLLDK